MERPPTQRPHVPADRLGHRRGVLLLVWLLVASAGLGTPPRAQAVGASDEPADVSAQAVLGRLGTVRAASRGIYEGIPREEQLLPWLVEAGHFTTLERVAELEVWLEPGDPVTQADLEELARKLRQTGLYAEVDVSTTEPDADGRIDIVIATRDKTSLVFGASGALVGDTGAVQGTIGENNLFGRGDSLTLSFAETTDDERNASLAFTDRHVFGRWLRFRAFGRTTEEGEGFGARLWRPRRQLAEPLEWGVGATVDRSDVDYFAGGDSVAEVPLDSTRFDAHYARGFGSRERYWQAGARVAFEDVSYGRARGPEAGRIDVPGATTLVRLSPFVRFDATNRFERVTGLDTLGFVQDLTLGTGVELEAGAVHRDEDGLGDELQPLLGASAYAAFEPLEDAYLTLDLGLSHRVEDGDTVGSSVRGALHGFYLAPGGHTLAASVTYDDVFEGQGLPREVTLGEDNGLRGYPSREFAGAERVRLNLEERWDLDFEWRTLRLGLVGFADAGWIAPDGADLGAPLWSTGIGLRIGSPEILGAGVVRIDLAFPLDRTDEYDPLLSVALGQVFSFFGNDSVLSTR